MCDGLEIFLHLINIFIDMHSFLRLEIRKSKSERNQSMLAASGDGKLLESFQKFDL